MIPKFREWDKENKKMYGCYGFNDLDWKIYRCNLANREFRQGHLETVHAVEDDLDNFVLMQSTGLKDKNGVEIFEGDIVKVSVHNGFDYYDNDVCVVRESRYHSGLVCINPNNDMECRIFNQDILEDYQYEVIGNIFEDKELLEVEG